MNADARPRVRDDLSVVRLDGEYVIYDGDSGSLHHLNTTASLVFSLCDGASTVRELVTDLSEAFDVSFADMEIQVRTLLDQLSQAALLDSHRD